jgi:5-methylcytosine-specific restriction endonuclease McrA
VHDLQRDKRKQIELQQLIGQLVDKCYECGVNPAVFLREKTLELEERKRIILTPSADWYRKNKRHYDDFATKMLGRSLNDSEKFAKGVKLSERIERLVFASGTGANLDYLDKKALLSRHHDRCAHCGRSLTIKNMHVDHILPRLHGGSDEIPNLQPLCEKCNLGKGAFREDTVGAAARPWFERTKTLLEGNIRLSDLKRFCVIARDSRQCQKCGKSSKEIELHIVLRVSSQDGGQQVYDNLTTLCVDCVNELSE